MKKQPRSSPRSGKSNRTVSIVGTGSYMPEKILTNAELTAMVDTTDEWITTRTGIKERRIAAKDEQTSDMAAKAALKALEQAEVAPKDVDLILVATATPDMLFPATACFRPKKNRRQKRRVSRYLRRLRRLSLRDRDRATIHYLAHSQHGARHRRGKTQLDHELDRPQHVCAIRRWRRRSRPPASGTRSWRDQHPHRERRRVHRHSLHARRRVALPDYAGRTRT